MNETNNGAGESAEEEAPAWEPPQHATPPPELEAQVILNQALAAISVQLKQIRKQLTTLAIIEQHVVHIGHQNDAAAVLQHRSFTASINPAAMEAATKQAAEDAKKLAEQEEAALTALEQARGGSHPPTDEDYQRAEEEFS